ncbi:subtilisin family serine protease [Streptomyces sp. 3330]|uniref:S8 family peptidase n=1 Tax=Streptomyces sp. 3330 TaxID=2817755 RepID=UPI002858656A|nr:S8 family peptidase [Streptomyces sp. 3330]MDR6980927.1 subtilisin family serine protease [Streptomyces sp. 3330]
MSIFGAQGVEDQVGRAGRIPLRSGLLVGAVLSALTAAAVVPGSAQAADPAPAERWIVQLKDTVADPGKVAEEQAKGQASDGGSRLRHVFDATVDGAALKGYALEATADQIAALRTDPQVASVEPDRLVSLPEPFPGSSVQAPRRRTGEPGGGGVAYQGDPLLAGQWGLFRIGAVAGSDHGFRVPAAARVGVAVLDTGVDAAHPDLRVAGNANFSSSPGAEDFHGHGTHVAGIVQALNNGVGGEGAAPGTLLWNVKVLGDRGSGLFSDVIAGLNWVARNARAKNIRVANMSLGTSADSPLVHQAVRLATRAGVAVVASAGNAGTTALNYPAAYPEVISVAATTVFDRRAPFSNHGAPWVDIAAPGADILSTLPTRATPLGEDHGFLSGTSMAAPFVTGAAALCLTSGHCHGNARDILRTLGRDARPVAGTGSDYRYGVVQVGCYWRNAARCAPRSVEHGAA